ncbi:MAG: MFS transporter, partial [Clostridiales bacterium]|nr:MFS transporter [Clostridiales bacterium]
KLGGKIRLERFMMMSALLCLASYLLASLRGLPFLGLVGCGLCGMSVGILWPGTFSMASASIRRGGTAMFALLALAGDVGCMGGPTFVGLMADHFGDDLKMGILFGVIFPILLIIGLILRKRDKKQVSACRR